MGFYETLRSCEIDPSAGCSPFALTVIAVVQQHYGGPLYSYWSCPPGDEPEFPEALYQRLMLTDWAFVLLKDEAHDDIKRYMAEEYEKAHGAWIARSQFCAMIEPPEVPPSGPPEVPPSGPPEVSPPGPGQFPPSVPPAVPPPGTEPPPKAAAGLGVGVLFVLGGVALMLAGRRR